jgi:hypothetical protein
VLPGKLSEKKAWQRVAWERYAAFKIRIRIKKIKMRLLITILNHCKFNIILGAILMIITSCSKKDGNIESINVLYYNYLFETPASIDCDKIKKDIPSFKNIPILSQEGDSIEGYIADNHGVLDTLIVDKKVLNEIENEIENAEWNIYPMGDTRISCSVNYKDGTKRKICICGFYSDELKCGNKMMKNSNRLLFIIKNSVGYYHWIHYDMLKYFDELNDTTFIREKIKSYEGKEY